MTIKMILAVDRGNSIGWKDGRLPWKLPGDLKRFAQKTKGNAVVMGSKTFFSLGRYEGLPERTNIVVSSRSPLTFNDSIGKSVLIYSSLDSVIDSYQRGAFGQQDLWVIGGASVYAEALQKKLIQELHLTLVDAASGADVELPVDIYSIKRFILLQAKEGAYWHETERKHTVDNGIPVTYITLEKL
jgi:dihydrofolate reductase